VTTPASVLPSFLGLEEEAPRTGIPAAAEPAERTTEVLPPDTAALVEAFRTLRTQLLVRARDGMKCFLVASARPEEGKSTIVLNLAATLAVARRRTLLVDGDLRRPSLHRLTDLTNRVGFADVLADGVPLSSAVRHLSPYLDLLTAGRSVADPQGLLVGRRVEAAIDAMRAAYEIVLFDSAPVLAVADTPLLAGRTDGVIVVVRGALPTTTDIRLVRQRLTAAGASIIGSVLNGFDDGPAQQYHPYSYPRPE